MSYYNYDQRSNPYYQPHPSYKVVIETPQFRQGIQAQILKQEQERARAQARKTLQIRQQNYDGAAPEAVVYFPDYRINGTVSEIVNSLKLAGIYQVNVGALYRESNGKMGCQPGTYLLSEEVVAACSYDLGYTNQPVQYDGMQGFFGNPSVQNALFAGGGGALGSALGGTLGGAIGAGAGPVLHNLISSQKEPWKQTLIEAGTAAAGGGLGSAVFHGPIGGGLGGAAGGYLGPKVAQKFDGSSYKPKSSCGCGH